MKDNLGTRIKEFYENRFRYLLPRRGFTIIRIDGRAFHTYTKKLNKPYDIGLMEDMDNTAAFLCKNIMGVRFAYVQSDEISLLLTDFETNTTQAWFDNNIQKMTSVAASMATAEFNKLRLMRTAAISSLTEDNINKFTLAEFDARVFQIPCKLEIENYFIWRQQDAMRNAVSMFARSIFSHTQLNKKNVTEMLEMAGLDNYENTPEGFRKGRLIVKTYDMLPPDPRSKSSEPVLRTKWKTTKIDKFTENKNILKDLINA